MELPPIMHSQRFRSLLLSFTLLSFAGYTLTSVRDTPMFSSDDLSGAGAESVSSWRGAVGEGGSGASQMSWKPSSWNVPSWAGSALRGAGVGGGSGQGDGEGNVKALKYVGDKVESLDGWQNGSLRDWQQSDEIFIPLYDPEPNYLPPTGAYTAGVVWLTRRSKLRDTLASLESLARYMPMEQAYAFIFMHSGDLASHLVQTSIRDRWDERAAEMAEGGEVGLADKMREMGRGIEFLEINMDAPESVARKGRDGLGDVVFANVWPGYHSMCRFFAVNIFWNHRIRQLDYYMRMDTDSYLLTPMHRDPFRRIQSTGQSYAYRHYGGDPEFVVSGMADYIESWVSDSAHAAALDLAGEDDTLLGGASRVQERIDTSKMIESSRGFRKGGMGAYYNNWELVHVASFRKPGVREWLEGLAMHDEGFYKYRWGDAPLRYATVQMFFEPEQYEHYCDFSYYHQFMMKEGTLISEDPPLWKC